MALKIRLQRQGRRHLPLYRIVVAEANAPRDGRFVESLGNYNPNPRNKDRELVLNIDRAAYWLSVGAQPSETAKRLIQRAKKEAIVELGTA